jgi:hypothetical protein
MIMQKWLSKKRLQAKIPLGNMPTVKMPVSDKTVNQMDINYMHRQNAYK